MALKLDKHDNDIIASLIKEGTITEKQLEELSTNHINKFELIKRSLFEKVFVVNNNEKKINILDRSFKELGSIDLPANSKQNYNPDEWQVWGNSVIAFDAENKKVGDFYWKPEDSFGIAFSKSKAYLYNPKFEDDKFLVSLENYIFGAVPKSKIESLPFDLYLSDDYSILCVTDRSAGLLHIIKVKENKLIKTFQIRSVGINKTINVSISKKRNEIFVTDNQSPNLIIINLQSLTMENKNLGIGILGNILISPDQENIYCIVLKPKQILKLIELKNFSFKKDFPLKGELFSTGDIPYDLLVSSIDKKFVYIMTHIPEPNPFTPVITVIEADKEKAVQRFSIKDESKPINLGFAEPNPLFKEKKSIVDLLIDNKVTDWDTVEEIKKNLQEQIGNSILQESTELDFSQTYLQSLTSQNKNENKDEVEWKIKDEPKKIGYTNISPALDEILFKKCKDKILGEYEGYLKRIATDEDWEKNEVEKRFRNFEEELKNADIKTEIESFLQSKASEDVEAEIELRFLALEETLARTNSMSTIRLNDAILKARQELEWYDISIIRLAGLIEKYSLEVLFTREDALEWLRQKERDELIETGLKTIATNCPNCDAQLLGSYTCRMCGFEVERPEDQIRRKLFSVATYDPFENLKHGNLMVIDVLHHKIVEVDHFKKIVWELKKDILHSDVQVDLEVPRDAVRLKNNITLVVDYETNRVFKLTRKGKLFWEFNHDVSPENKLYKPVSASALESGNIIIVDSGNHRILEVNTDSEIVWRYGQKGVDGIGDNLLRYPMFFQRTQGATNLITDTQNHRVVELEGNKVVWQYGNENNIEGEGAAGDGLNELYKPLSAWRYGDGYTLILDAGNNRIIEVDRNNEILWEYKTNEGPEDGQVENPVRIYRLRTSNIVIVGEKKVVEIDHSGKRVIWSSSISELAKDEKSQDVYATIENIKKTKIKHGVVNPYAKKQAIESFEEKAKREKMQSYLASKKSELSSRGSALSNRSPVILTPGANVSDIELMIVDKNKGNIYRLNRKGVHTWTFGENQELAKPQYVYYNPPHTAFICDSENKRVIEVELETNSIIWSYEGSESEKLAYPRCVEITPRDTILIADQLGGKVIEINKSDLNIVWEYRGLDFLKTPYHATRLKNGNTLIVDWSSNIVIEVSPHKEVAWSYGVSKKSGSEKGFLSYPESAQRLDNGNTLITDTRNARILEVSPDKEIVWSFEGQGLQKIMSPTYAERLADGNTLIVHSNNKQIIEVDSNGKVLWKYMHQDKRI